MKKKGCINNSFVTWAKRRNIPVTYKTVVLVPYYDGYKNVLTQDMISEENVKYVIKHDYWLNEETITVPEHSILEFDGGTLHNGTIIGQDTFINDIGGLGLEKLFAEDIVREGTWRTNGRQVQSDWNQGDNTKLDYIKNKPTIPEAQVQSDWNQNDSSKKDFIKNKPTLAGVATSGNYNDLKNKPTIPEVDTALSKTSTNPVQNKTVTEALEESGHMNKSYDPTKHSGLGRKTIKLKEGGSNVLTQEDFNAANTIYIIQYDFVLGEDITIPENCVLEFDGGTITQGNNYFLNGPVLNSYLDVSKFTINNNIDWALFIALSLSNAFIPKGQWTLTSTVDIPTGKTIFGSGIESKILLQDASIRLYKVVQVMIKDIELIIESSSNIYAIAFNGGVRNSTIQDITIRGSIAYSSTAVCCGILFKEDVTEEYIGNVGIVINNVFIRDVKIGMCLDSNTQPSTDYITSSRFDNIYIDRFNDIAIKIIGTRNYTCNFNGLTIADNTHNGQTHYGLYFDGGYLNNFTNLAIWADARNTTDEHGNQRFQDPNEFYAVYIARELQSIGAGYITGYIEGMIGGIENYNLYFDRFQYDLYFYEVSSLDNTSKYQGWMSNYISTHCPFKSIFNLNTLKITDFELASGTNISVVSSDKGIKIYNTTGQDGSWNVRFTLNRYLTAGKKYRLFALFDCEKNSSEDLGVMFRFIEGVSTKSYLNAADRFKNRIVSSTTIGSLENVAEGNSNNIELRIETSVKTLYLKALYIIEYTPDYPIDFITKQNSVELINKEYSDILQPTNPIGVVAGLMTYHYIDNVVIPVWAQANKKFTEYDSAIAGVKRVGTFAEKPTSTDIYIGFKYFCTDKQTAEGLTDGIEIIHKGSGVWVDALGRVVS